MIRVSFIAAPPLDGAVAIRAGSDAFRRLDRGGWLSRAPVKDGVAVLRAPPPPLERVVVLDGEDWRAMGAKLAEAVADMEGGALSVIIDGADSAELAYGYRLKAGRALSLRSRPAEDDPAAGPAELVIAAPDPMAAEARFARLDAVAEGVHLARELVALPGNLLGPRELAERAQALAALGVDVQVLDPAAHGLNLLAAVGQGSVRPPALAIMRWKGAGGHTRPLVLVGKGITFDAGGISIKPAERMEEMKGDMGGAAAVLGALHAIARRKAGCDVVGILALAENMPSGGALRPGDVVYSHAGLNVEVVDTDAEGRLVLADALSWACRNLNPRLMVDIATLTGAVVRTLGRHRAGLYTPGARLARMLEALGEDEGELLWRLPLSEAFDEDLKSQVADLRNCGWGTVPDANDAARFLQHFVDRRIPWAHLDIAGVSEAEEPHAFGPKGPTGFGVRLFDRLAGE